MEKLAASTILVSVAIAFVVGSITTGTMAYAGSDVKGKPFETLWSAIMDLQSRVTALEESGSDMVLHTYTIIHDEDPTEAGIQGIRVERGDFAEKMMSCDAGDLALSAGKEKLAGIFSVNVPITGIEYDSGFDVNSITIHVYNPNSEHRFWVPNILCLDSADPPHFP